MKREDMFYEIVPCAMVVTPLLGILLVIYFSVTVDDCPKKVIEPEQKILDKEFAYSVINVKYGDKVTIRSGFYKGCLLKAMNYAEDIYRFSILCEGVHQGYRDLKIKEGNFYFKE